MEKQGREKGIKRDLEGHTGGRKGEKKEGIYKKIEDKTNLSEGHVGGNVEAGEDEVALLGRHRLLQRLRVLRHRAIRRRTAHKM